MKRKLTLMTLLLMMVVGLWAQNTTQRLVVWQKSGEKVYFDLKETPETTFEDGLLVIRSSKTTVSYQLENILRYTYEGVNPSSIDLLPSEREVIVAKDGDGVTFRNLRDGSTVSVYSANGMLVEQRTATAGQPLTISIAQRPAGVYVVKAGKETIKLMKP
ncbi:T9SS type A sorting domain-containing protein [Prevotella sp. E2-28]|uniref:T9SS type A sorting domain-containing protein n=1 Tax=Prevotella sp. E2-28 TaxID=2913620 RepID=UPI001EDC831B|nr:T9SS type A sorting domain-containing protein [Prevotella sp. E2-28]UKK54880.1 T9SS type A sorting domain-containing protein [Prevotella sp. E2-28]